MPFSRVKPARFKAEGPGARAVLWADLYATLEVSFAYKSR